MSYQTRYSLEIIEGNPSLIEKLRSENDWAHSMFNNDGKPNDSGSWYSHSDDLCAFSMEHPFAVFKLIGEGEEVGDLWQKYFKDGKMQVCEAIISYHPYNPLYLK